MGKPVQVEGYCAVSATTKLAVPIRRNGSYFTDLIYFVKLRKAPAMSRWPMSPIRLSNQMRTQHVLQCPRSAHRIR